MFILPIGHDHTVVHRVPWVTIGIVVVNLLVFFVTWRHDSIVEEDLKTQLSEVVVYWREHTYLEAPRDVRELGVRGAFDDRKIEPPPANRSADEIRSEQQELDRKIGAYLTKERTLSAVRWGFVPNGPSPITAITSQFLHAGILHIVFNLWFLWLAGYNVEDAWGRTLFLFFYLASGVAAAFTHALFAADSSVPLVGASGALAGAMGAFTAIRTRAKLRFFALVIIRPMVFSAPALVMLPLWLVGEAVDGYLSSGSGGGVAHWAHVGGFVFGLAFAMILRVTGVHARLDPLAERESETRRIVALDQPAPLARAGFHGARVPNASPTDTVVRDVEYGFGRRGPSAACAVGQTVTIRRGSEALPAIIVEIRGDQFRCETADGRKVWVFERDLGPAS